MINKTWNSTQGRFNYLFTFAFRSKADYLAFRQQWKENYVALSKSIRDLKASIKTSMRKRGNASEAPREILGILGAQQGNLRALKSEASMQISMRLAGKRMAGHQYRESKQITK